MTDRSDVSREPAEQETKIARVYGALAHPIRVGIIELLHANGQMTAGAIVAAVGKEQSHVAQHLRYLRQEGLVRAEKQGRNVIYRLADQELGALIHLLNRELVNGPPAPPRPPAPASGER